MLDHNTVTVADIVAEMRDCAATKINGRTITEHAMVPQSIVLQWADRIEAAYKREMGDAAKMREALAPFPSLCEWLIVNAGKDALGKGVASMVPLLRKRMELARAALSAPPRNCDRFATGSDDNVSLLVDEVREHARRLSGGEYYIIPEQVVRYLLAPAG